MKKDYQKPYATHGPKAIYHSFAPKLDPDGFILFRAAQDILGNLDYSCFPYEDNRGYFEDADGKKLLQYLLIQYVHVLGEANILPDRWQIVCSGYEKCVDLSIDETTPEYMDFEHKLYTRVLERLGISEQAEMQNTEVAL